MKSIRKAASLTQNMMTNLRTWVNKSLNRSDLKRWKAGGSLLEDWDSRSKLMCEYIAPGSKVIEFGAGRMVVKSYLPEGCSYLPLDIVDRGNGTLVCDLNKSPLPDFGYHHYAIMSGVLEYIIDVPRLIRHISPMVGSVVASYAVRRNENTLNRGLHGWVNHFTESELVGIFEQNGYFLSESSAWRNQLIFVFRK